MINVDVIIKTLRSRGDHHYGWPRATKEFLKRLNNLKLGFPGIRDNHLSLITYRELKKDDIFIWDVNLNFLSLIELEIAPRMIRILDDNITEGIIEGIGCGSDEDYDFNLETHRWQDKVKLSSFNINSSMLVLRVDVRPTLNGGPGYYYFFRSYRDFRK